MEKLAIKTDETGKYESLKSDEPEKSIFDLLGDTPEAEEPPPGIDPSDFKELFQAQDIDPDQLFRQEDEQNKEEDKEEPQDAKNSILGEHDAQLQGQLLSFGINTGVARLCSAISGMDYERYTLSDRDAKRHEELTTRYFLATGKKVNPTSLFVLGTFVIFSDRILQAWNDRQKRQAETRRQNRNPAQDQSHLFQVTPPADARRRPSPQPAETKKSIFENGNTRPFPYEIGRSYFQVDRDEFYLYDSQRNYLRVSERKEKRSPFVKEFWESLPDNLTTPKMNEQTKEHVLKNSSL